MLEGEHLLMTLENRGRLAKLKHCTALVITCETLQSQEVSGVKQVPFFFFFPSALCSFPVKLFLRSRVEVITSLLLCHEDHATASKCSLAALPYHTGSHLTPYTGILAVTSPEFCGH